jgi:hypothetical protein
MKVYTVTFSFGVLSVDVFVEAINRKAARQQAVAVGNANAQSLVAVDQLFLAAPFGVGGVRINPPRFSASAIADVKEHVEVFA